MQALRQGALQRQYHLPLAIMPWEWIACLACTACQAGKGCDVSCLSSQRLRTHNQLIENRAAATQQAIYQAQGGVRIN